MAVSLRSRVVGAVLGAAIGDAMGHSTEFLSLAEIRHRYPPAGVTRYELYWERDGRRFAPYTDDTQMAEIVLATLSEAVEADWPMDETMARMAPRFAEWRVNPQGGHRAPGNSCMAGARRLGEGVPWQEAGAVDAGGCGSVMRAYPFGILFHDSPSTAVEWAVQHSKLTHRAPIALAACAGMAAGMAAVLGGSSIPDAVAMMISAASEEDSGTAAMMNDARLLAETGAAPDAVLTKYLGWAAHDAIAAATFVVLRHPDDPAAAILEGANSEGDSDSIATLAGALLGAKCGVESLPAEWVRDVERSDELCELAERAATLTGG